MSRMFRNPLCIELYISSSAWKRIMKVMSDSEHVILLSLLCLFSVGLVGCTAPLAVQGLSSTSPVAFSNIDRGSGDSFWLARYDDVVQATLRAGQALSLTLDNKQIEKDETVFHFVGDREKKMKILIERRTETMTYAHFDVGFFGSKSMGRLMARQIFFEIDEAEAFLRNRHPAEDN
jgi:hypothetical protein